MIWQELFDDAVFWGQVDKTPGHGPWNNCWVWKGKIDPNGYGLFKRTIPAHRVSFSDANKIALSKTDFICHRCDFRSCVRPAHLFLGDVRINVQDMIDKKRHHNQKKNTCPNGHPYDATYLFKRVAVSGRPVVARVCKRCSNAQRRTRQRWDKMVRSLNDEEMGPTTAAFFSVMTELGANRALDKLAGK